MQVPENTGVHLKEIFSGLDPARADLVLLVLASQGIGVWIKKTPVGVDLLVSGENASRALSAVRKYDRENRPKPHLIPLETLGMSAFSSVGAWGIALVLCLVHLAVRMTGDPQSVFLRYGASSLFILQGETYRAVTALFLHADTRHLIGNMAGMIIFVSPVFKLSGWGTGMLILLFSGTGANLICAHLRHNAAISIGASTAVMAGAGLLCGFQLLYRRRGSIFQYLVPLFAGSLLVAMLSQGEKTDIAAHLYGFLAGLGSGIVFFPVDRLFRWKEKQAAAFVFVLAVLIISGFRIIC